MELSEEQRRAVTHVNGPMMVLAGPGAGKTTTITRRIIHLIEREGANPARILVVTFSKAAAVEMQERFERLTGGRHLPVWFGTFHSLFFRVLRAAYHYRPGDIVSQALKYRFLEEALMETEYDDVEDRKEFLEEVEKEISRIKGEGTDIEHYYSASCPEEIFRKIYKGYQARVSKNHCLDFDDMVLYTYELFTKRPDILSRWRGSFDYILIDEFQDINRLQYENVKLLAYPANNLFIVGDDDQSIYGFRGARPDIMLAFPREYPGLRRVTIGGNYRSSSQILTAATDLIAHNRRRYEKELKAFRGPGDAVHVSRYEDVAGQADAVVTQIREYLSEGTRPDQIAVLLRTARQMNVFSRKLMEYNVPFVMKDRIQNLFDHWVAKDILTYIRMACGDRSRASFLKIANRPKRYLSRAAFQEKEISFGALYEYYRDKAYMCERIHDLQTDLSAVKDMTPYSAVDYIFHVMRYEDFLREYAAERNVQPGDWEEVVAELKEDASGYSTLPKWLEHVEEYGRQLEERARRAREGGKKSRGSGGQEPPDGEEQERGVALMTMHGSKGLEYNIVFIPDVNEGLIPYQRSIDSGNIEEERRLLYVAMTRARDHLHLSYTKQRFQKDTAPSRFLGEIDGGKRHDFK